VDAGEEEREIELVNININIIYVAGGIISVQFVPPSTGARSRLGRSRRVRTELRQREQLREEFGCSSSQRPGCTFEADGGKEVERGGVCKVRVRIWVRVRVSVSVWV